MAVISAAGSSPPAGWTRAVSDYNNTNECIDVFFKARASAQATSTGFTGNAAIAMEFSGNFGDVDQTATNFGFGTSLSTGTTPTQSYTQDLMLGTFACLTQNPGGFSGGHILVDQFSGLTVVYVFKTTTAGSSVTASIGTPATWAGAAVTIKP